MRSSHLTYRPDIDGLRAIAVLAVVAFHAAPGRVAGGFVGVDIFFVISGYLISTIIIKSLENESFSFADFYARRVRRIFPALLFVMSISLAAGWFLLVNNEYEQLGKHIAGGAAFISNFVLLSESSYFDTEAIFKPFLHLWSLGIEEQFYIFWPLILWAAYIKQIRLIQTIVFITGLSFLLSLYLTYTNPVSAFYLPFSRFWELLIGSILAHVVLHRRRALHNRITSGVASDNIKSLLGTICIFIGFAFITKDDGFPGLWALLPVVGTVLIISAGSDAYLNKHVYSNRLLVGVGLISYPLYLWHWPVLSFLRTLQSGEISPWQRIIAVAISVTLAWMTYKLIEKPIISSGAKKRRITMTLILLMIITGSLGYFSFASKGFYDRFGWAPTVVNKGDIGHNEFFKYMEEHYYPCTPKIIHEETEEWNGFVGCHQSKDAFKKDIAIIGDSHAEAMFVGIAEAFETSNVVYYARGALPFTEKEEFDEIFNFILQESDIKVVFIKARWLAKFKGIDNDLLQRNLKETAGSLIKAGRKVLLVEDVPEFPFEPNVCKYDRSAVSIVKCSIKDRNQSSQYMKLFEAVQQQVPGVKIIKTHDFFCSKGSCAMAKDGNLLFRDTNHLNAIGSIALGEYIINEYPSLEINNVDN